MGCLSTVLGLFILSFPITLSFQVSSIVQLGSRLTIWQEKRHLSASQDDDDVFDIVVVGAGLGGLSCAALCSKYGLKTLCVEAHDTPGGCAHTFARYSPKASKETPFRFDSGPSLISGISSKSTNPLRQVLDAIGTADAIEWCNYDGWIVHDTSDDKSFKLTTGSGGQWEQAIEEKAGKEARKAFHEFQQKIMEPKGLSEASAYIPPFALRGDLGALASLAKYFLQFLSIGTKGTLLTGPFTRCMDLYGVRGHSTCASLLWSTHLRFSLAAEKPFHSEMV